MIVWPGSIMLDEGSHPRVDDSTSTSTMPVTNSGSDMVTSPPSVRNRSQKVSALTPTSTPVTSPSGTAMQERCRWQAMRRVEQPSADDARRCPCRSRLCPGHPVTAPPIQLQVSEHGAACPVPAARADALRLSGVAPCPSMVEAASPGVNSIREKMATETASSVTTMRDILSMRNRAISYPSPRLSYRIVLLVYGLTSALGEQPF